MQALASPLVATAVVGAIHRQVTSEEFFTDHVALSALPHFFLLLLRIVKLQPTVHLRVVVLVRDALPVVGAERPEAAKSFIRVLVQLLLHGRVAEVLTAVEGWARDADPALIRFFALQVCASVRLKSNAPAGLFVGWAHHTLLRAISCIV